MSYHLGRTLSYGAIGVVLGGLGSAVGIDALGAPAAIVAFVLAAGLVVLALLGERGALAVPGLGQTLQRALACTRRWSPAARAGALGLCTPLLPCGLLWAACAAAGVAGGPAAGGGVMTGFALGSLPLLLLAQTQVTALARRFGARTLLFVQRAAMLLAAGMLVWRGLATMNGSSCCH